MNFFIMSIKEIFSQFNTEHYGLTEIEADKRLEQYGANEIKKQKEISPLLIFITQFKGFIVYVLIGAVAISIYLGEYIDSVVIIIILILNAILGFIQEFRAEKSIETLKKMSALYATVIRNGVKNRIDTTEVVPGDIIVFESGDKIPADARIIEASLLEVMESTLTGESLPVRKVNNTLSGELTVGDQKNMVFSGTNVTKGSGKAVVVATGMDTQIGKIAKSIESVEDEESPLKKNLDSLGKKIGFITIFVCVVVVLLGLYRGGNLMEMIMVGVSLAVAAIPEGLPIVVTISLAIGVQKMVSSNALIKKLHSVETLGATTVICTDKTGTLTRNEMTVTKIFLNDRLIDVTGTGYSTEGNFLEHQSQNKTHIKLNELTLLLESGVLNNDASLKENNSIIGDPTEASLLVSAAKAGLDIIQINKTQQRVFEIPFDSDRKRKSTVHEKDDTYIMYTKGAPELLIELCDTIIINGEVFPLTEDHKNQIIEVNKSLAEKAIRVLGFAFKDVYDNYEQVEEKGLTFIGLQGMIDPPRKEVKNAIATCHKAGIRTIMITGDHALTAQAIAEELGMKGEVISGHELETFSDNIIREKVKTVSIFARVSPEHKIKIVRALRNNEEIVAMTGDGVNDAPAIKEADIGIAMGITGTDVSKDTADMILTDDKYTSILKAVEQGRGIYENIKKFVNYLLSSNMGEVLILFLAMVIGFKDSSGAIAVPLLATQILWLNLVTDGLPAVTLGIDPIRKKIMTEKPRPSGEGIINLQMALSILLISGLMCASVLYLFNQFIHEGAAIARTVAFTSIVVLELVRVTMIRAQYKQPFFSNPLLYASLGISFVLQVLVVYVPFLNSIFKTKPLSLEHWIYITAVSAILFIAGLIVNFGIIFFMRKRSIH